MNSERTEFEMVKRGFFIIINLLLDWSPSKAAQNILAEALAWLNCSRSSAFEVLRGQPHALEGRPARWSLCCGYLAVGLRRE